ncbi:MAG: hypothetical protein GKR90_13355 [Pseudomonadales bacterium]|nr:hypothetical protein [Pseudomonadales bacterium]
MNIKLALVIALTITSSLNCYAEDSRPTQTADADKLAEIVVTAEKTNPTDSEQVPQLATAEVQSLILEELSIRLRSAEQDIAWLDI